METAYRERDLRTEAINVVLRKSRTLLKGLNSSNPKRLGEWGYEVNDSPRPSKQPKKGRKAKSGQNQADSKDDQASKQA